MKKLTLTLLGTTASGKSKFAVELSKKISAEIISLDSASIYKEFNIGTAKPSPDERESIPHHLIDIANPDEPFSAFHFIQFSKEAILKIESNKKLPLICGGSYFYLRALEHGMFPDVNVPQTVIDSLEQEYTEEDSLQSEKMHKELSNVDSESAKKIHPKDTYRLLRALSIYRHTKILPSTLQAKPILEDSSKRLWLKYALIQSRTELTQAISQRTDEMLQKGIVEETKSLLEKYPQSRALENIGYFECVQFLKNKITEKQLRTEIIEKTRQLAKRQMTWLRGDPGIRFIDKNDLERVVLEIENLKYALG